jgi:hypothetical protein
VAAGILAVTTTLLMTGGATHQPAPFPMEAAEKLTVDRLAEKESDTGALILPTWMPGEVKLREIYFKNLAILVYSERDVRDYREDDVTIQISQTHLSPTVEQLQQSTSGEVTEIQGFPAVILENAAPGPDMEKRGTRPIIAYFWHDGFYYIVTGNKGQITRGDITGIIENMKPIGPETLRKPAALSPHEP